MATQPPTPRRPRKANATTTPQTVEVVTSDVETVDVQPAPVTAPNAVDDAAEQPALTQPEGISKSAKLTAHKEELRAAKAARKEAERALKEAKKAAKKARKMVEKLQKQLQRSKARA